MSCGSCRAFLLIFASSLTFLISCGQPAVVPVPAPGSADAGAPDGGDSVRLDAPVSVGNYSNDAGPCTPRSCTPAGGEYCGAISDGCGKTLDCGDCPAGQSCGIRGLKGVCGFPLDSCTALTCQQPTGQYCGDRGDGCGGLMHCGDCSAGTVCGDGPQSGLCVPPRSVACTPLTCATAGGQYCGRIGNGCGGTLDCGDCPAGQTCGGGGSPSVCGAAPDPGCKPLACAIEGGQYCGTIGDGCGGTLSCGACASGLDCGSSGTPHLCPGAGQHTCQNLECQQNSCLVGPCVQHACTGAAKTTLSGTVYDPAGKVPLYNVIVYVPNAPLDPLASGAICDKCATPSGQPIATAVTDAKGEFKLENVPVGTDIPLVMQVGKWRRQTTIPAVLPCVDNAISDKNLTRLPRNRTEGNIPRIALSTGGADALECLLRKIGVEDGEFTPEAGPGRINMFAGTAGTASYAPRLNGGASLSVSSSALWRNVESLQKYDLVLLSCEGGSWHAETKGVDALAAMTNYANLGGRIFASHWHNYWIENAPPPVPSVAKFKPCQGDDTVHCPDLPDPFNAQIDTSFPKGAALADWLVNVQASTTRGYVTIRAGKNTLESTTADAAQRWIYADTPVAVQYMTFNTPVTTPPDQQCGRVVFTDIHVTSGSGDVPKLPFPTGCVTTDLSAQEKALEFMLFDLAACLQPDAKPVIPPQPPEAPLPPATPPPLPPAAPPPPPPPPIIVVD